MPRQKVRFRVDDPDFGTDSIGVFAAYEWNKGAWRPQGKSRVEKVERAMAMGLRGADFVRRPPRGSIEARAFKELGLRPRGGYLINRDVNPTQYQNLRVNLRKEGFVVFTLVAQTDERYVAALMASPRQLRIT